jgi:hypothetical protein
VHPLLSSKLADTFVDDHLRAARARRRPEPRAYVVPKVREERPARGGQRALVLASLVACGRLPHGWRPK